MSDNLNIRDFRNSGQSGEAADSEKGNRGFYTCLIAIPVLAALAGVGYKPLMEMRGNNVVAGQMTEAIDPNSAIAMLQSSDFSDPNNPIIGATKNSGKEFSGRALTPNEFLNRVDAKAHGFSALDMEVLKYTRTEWALNVCSHRDLYNYYTRSNKTKYLALKTKADLAKAAQRRVQSKQLEQLEIPKIENKTQALAFIASGGVARHQKAAMSGFASINGLQGDMKKSDVRRSRPRFDKRGCMQVRTIVQSGAMTVKENIRLRG